MSDSLGMPRPTPHALLNKRLIMLLRLLLLPPRALLPVGRNLQRETAEPDGEADEIYEAEAGLGVAGNRVDEVNWETSESDPGGLAEPVRFER